MKLSTMIILLALLLTPYVWNASKLLSCDFESNYKCEVIHGIGVVIPPAAFVTVWFAGDED